MAVSDLGNTGDVGDVARRIAQRLHKHGFGAIVDQLVKAVRIAVISKLGGDAKLRQRVRKQVVGAPYKAVDDTMLSPASAMV